MSIQIPSYIDIVRECYPEVQCSVLGDGFDYELIAVHSGILPSRAELDAMKITMIKDRMWRLIQIERDLRKVGGVQVAGKWFHSDDTSRIQQLGLIMFGANMPAGIMWKTMDGTFVPMTPTLAQQIFVAIATCDQQIFAVAEQKKVQLNASASPETFMYTAGWPEVYV